MTLIVVGYTGRKFFRKAIYDSTFFVGDTLISRDNPVRGGRDRMIENYQKIRTIPVTVCKPCFDTEGYFRGYQDSMRSKCVIAFAGSSLTFHHMLNGIQEHLRQLRYTFFDQTYKIVKHCSSEAITYNHAQVWDEDIFVADHNLPKLSASFVIEVVSHVIRKALKDVSGHRLLAPGEFDGLKCELAVATHCWETNKPSLFHIEVGVDTSSIPYQPTHYVRRLEEEEICVLGLRSEEEEARALLQEVRAQGKSERKAIEEFLRDKILEDLVAEQNYIGGFVDSWRVDSHEVNQRYLRVEQEPVSLDE